jgi:hypothetical protein
MHTSSERLGGTGVHVFEPRLESMDESFVTDPIV